MSDIYDDLEKLDNLRKKGIITEEEFNIKKKELLNKGSQPTDIKNNTENDIYASYDPHYQNAFKKFDAIILECKKNKIEPHLIVKFFNWNWAGFFFGPLWAFYKKQWSYAIVILILSIFLWIPWIFPGLQGDFYEYYRAKTGKTWFWRPITAFREIAATMS
jgi:hypothetical protein